MNSNAEKGWRAALDSWFDSKILNVHTSFPAVVEAVNSDNTVDVIPLIKTKLSDGSQKLYPTIPDVRLQIYSAKKGNSFITVPVTQGDNVWVFVSERDMANVMDSDGQSAQDATTLNTHDLSDCFCVPCFSVDSNAIPIDPDNIVISNGNTTITIKESEVVVDTNSYKINADSVNITASSFNVDSSSFTHNGVDVGSTHIHSGGTIDGLTGVPEL
jgi:hypothetical protein